jgi:hypothetical protein
MENLFLKHTNIHISYAHTLFPSLRSYNILFEERKKAQTTLEQNEMITPFNVAHR